jgi:L,D-transpeptidase catalytic domain
VLDRGKVLERYTVAIGTPDAPTPTGRFAVTDRLVTNDPGGPYGCCILALSAHALRATQG